ncbi:MerR family transcriptional regulator [Micromonospora trifolii]|uniref:MerR family transcriptional regulator n=1 Tax=Micromonospora trifolii TaxID=2911208 RepID=UPI003D2F02AF
MNGHTLHSIGQLARQTGTSVKTIRFYSDCGLIPPADRSPAGYRLYENGAVARLDFVRTLRDLGLDLTAIRAVMIPGTRAIGGGRGTCRRVGRADPNPAAAACTADRRGGAWSYPWETHLMHKLAKLSEAKRQQLVGDFLDASFGGVDTGSIFAGITRSMTPELPDDNDPRRERYLSLLAVVIGWPGPQSLPPVLDWAVHALQPRIQG